MGDEGGGVNGGRVGVGLGMCVGIGVNGGRVGAGVGFFVGIGDIPLLTQDPL